MNKFQLVLTLVLLSLISPVVKASVNEITIHPNQFQNARNQPNGRWCAEANLGYFCASQQNLPRATVFVRSNSVSNGKAIWYPQNEGTRTTTASARASSQATSDWPSNWRDLISPNNHRRALEFQAQGKSFSQAQRCERNLSPRGSWVGAGCGGTTQLGVTINEKTYLVSQQSYVTCFAVAGAVVNETAHGRLMQAYSASGCAGVARVRTQLVETRSNFFALGSPVRQRSN